MSREKVIHHKGSILLSHDENLKVFSLIESKCVALATSIVQLYTTEQPAHSHWIKRGTGVLCLIRDSYKRSYFLRLYCTVKDSAIWEHELYTTIIFNRVRPYFMTFEGENNTVAINFASEEEAQDFYDTAASYAYRMANRKKRRPHSQEEIKPSPPNITKPAEPQEEIYEEIPHHVTLRKAEKQPEQTNFNSLFGPDRTRVQRKVGLNKTSIGRPTDFVHVAHIGFDQDRGFDTRGETKIIDQFLKKAGVYDAYTTDRETKAFIDDFMQQNNVLDEIKSEYDNDENESTVQRNNTSTIKSTKHSKLNAPKATTPRPPPRQGPPMPSIPAPILPGAQRHDIKTSKPNSGGGGGPAPPPPPPPPPAPPMMDPSFAPPMPPSAPSQQRQQLEAAQDDPRSALLDSIRKGANLKKTGPGEIDNRVASTPPADSGPSTKTDILASALIRAITERRQHMVNSDNSEDEGRGGDDDDWE